MIPGLAQKESGQRQILISMPDSVIKTSILEKQMKKKVTHSCIYYWYYAGQINHNLGGFSGKLITGSYEVFDNKHRLIVSGKFHNGTKEGNWIRWHLNGEIKEICSFRNGKLEGTLKSYNNMGGLLTDMHYKNNLPDGKAKYYLKDTVIIKKYSSGKEVTEKSSMKWFAKKKQLKPIANIPAIETQEKQSVYKKLFTRIKKHESENKDSKAETKIITKK
jgi:antitoxin component YwqK of YwqJK toxin-antitoxin module